MLIIPFDRRIDWKNPPLITLFLLAANILIFLLFQLNDSQEVIEAEVFYQSSGLQKIEKSHYKKHLLRQARMDQGLSETAFSEDDSDSDYSMWEIQTDLQFQQQLHAGRIITPKSEDYVKWQKKRQDFEEKFESITFVGYGLRTAKPSLVTLGSHMFLHGGFWHLLGNGIFLLAVGLLVESTLGRWTYLFCYLLTGFGSAAFDFIFNSGSLVPGIGASGAISGLMGMYAVLYGLRKIRFFYSIGIYFDYIRLPAIILLPMWIGNELVQIILYSDVSNINYLAHLGGLVTGAIIAFIAKHKAPSFNVDFLEQEERDDAFEQKLQQVRELCNTMDYRKALVQLRSLYRKNSEHREVLCRYYECSRVAPESDEYHKLSRSIFNLSETDRGTDSLVFETYAEYLKLARPTPRFNADTLCKLAERFIRQGMDKEADKLVRVIIKKSVSCGAGKELILSHADLLDQKGLSSDAARYRQLCNKTDVVTP
ncbi:MAG: rhomboid family intramembrane serine protease [Sedimenticola sp.]